MKIDPAVLEYLRGLAEATVSASRVRVGERVGSSPVNTTGGTLIRPGGRASYPAFWVRDFAMSLGAGFVTDEEVRHALAVTARRQNGEKERRLRGGAAVIPPWAVADHVNFDGGAVFYPGTYSSGEDQGGEPFGVRPPVCDHYYFIDVAHHLVARDAETVKGLMPRLEKAFGVPEVDEKTGVVTTSAATRAVGMGFYDCVYLSGAMLFPTLLRWRAATQMAAIWGKLDDENRAAEYYAVAATVKAHVGEVFVDRKEAGGWLLAATEVGRQPDVWGTIYALHLGILDEAVAKAAREAVIDGVRKGTMVYRAGVRHIPVDHDHSPESAWQQAVPGVRRGTYQNGAYWHTATGWLVSALWEAEPTMATKLVEEYVGALKEDDFRKGEAHGAPWECFGKDNGHRQNPVYMASVALPYAVIRDLDKA